MLDPALDASWRRRVDDSTSGSGLPTDAVDATAAPASGATPAGGGAAASDSKTTTPSSSGKWQFGRSSNSKKKNTSAAASPGQSQVFDNNEEEEDTQVAIDSDEPSDDEEIQLFLRPTEFLQFQKKKQVQNKDKKNNDAASSSSGAGGGGAGGKNDKNNSEQQQQPSPSEVNDQPLDAQQVLLQRQRAQQQAFEASDEFKHGQRMKEREMRLDDGMRRIAVLLADKRYRSRATAEAMLPVEREADTSVCYLTQVAGEDVSSIQEADHHQQQQREQIDFSQQNSRHQRAEIDGSGNKQLVSTSSIVAVSPGTAEVSPIPPVQSSSSVVVVAPSPSPAAALTRRDDSPSPATANAHLESLLSRALLLQSQPQDLALAVIKLHSALQRKKQRTAQLHSDIDIIKGQLAQRAHMVESLRGSLWREILHLRMQLSLKQQTQLQMMARHGGEAVAQNAAFIANATAPANAALQQQHQDSMTDGGFKQMKRPHAQESIGISDDTFHMLELALRKYDNPSDAMGSLLDKAETLAGVVGKLLDESAAKTAEQRDMRRRIQELMRDKAKANQRVKELYKLAQQALAALSEAKAQQQQQLGGMSSGRADTKNWALSRQMTMAALGLNTRKKSSSNLNSNRPDGAAAAAAGGGGAKSTEGEGDEGGDGDDESQPELSLPEGTVLADITGDDVADSALVSKLLNDALEENEYMRQQLAGYKARLGIKEDDEDDAEEGGGSEAAGKNQNGEQADGGEDQQQAAAGAEGRVGGERSPSVASNFSVSTHESLEGNQRENEQQGTAMVKSTADFGNEGGDGDAEATGATPAAGPTPQQAALDAVAALEQQQHQQQQGAGDDDEDSGDKQQQQQQQDADEGDDGAAPQLGRASTDAMKKRYQQSLREKLELQNQLKATREALETLEKTHSDVLAETAAGREDLERQLSEMNAAAKKAATAPSRQTDAAQLRAQQDLKKRLEDALQREHELNAKVAELQGKLDGDDDQDDSNGDDASSAGGGASSGRRSGRGGQRGEMQRWLFDLVVSLKRTWMMREVESLQALQNCARAALVNARRGGGGGGGGGGVENGIQCDIIPSPGGGAGGRAASPAGKRGGKTGLGGKRSVGGGGAAAASSPSRKPGAKQSLRQQQQQQETGAGGGAASSGKNSNQDGDDAPDYSHVNWSPLAFMADTEELEVQTDAVQVLSLDEYSGLQISLASALTKPEAEELETQTEEPWPTQTIARLKYQIQQLQHAQKLAAENGAGGGAASGFIGDERIPMTSGRGGEDENALRLLWQLEAEEEQAKIRKRYKGRLADLEQHHQRKAVEMKTKLDEAKRQLEKQAVQLQRQQALIAEHFGSSGAGASSSTSSSQQLRGASSSFLAADASDDQQHSYNSNNSANSAHEFAGFPLLRTTAAASTESGDGNDGEGGGGDEADVVDPSTIQDVSELFARRLRRRGTIVGADGDAAAARMSQGAPSGFSSSGHVLSSATVIGQYAAVASSANIVGGAGAVVGGGGGGGAAAGAGPGAQQAARPMGALQARPLPRHLQSHSFSSSVRVVEDQDEAAVIAIAAASAAERRRSSATAADSASHHSQSQQNEILPHSFERLAAAGGAVSTRDGSNTTPIFNLTGTPTTTTANENYDDVLFYRHCGCQTMNVEFADDEEVVRRMQEALRRTRYEVETSFETFMRQQDAERAAREREAEKEREARRKQQMRLKMDHEGRFYLSGDARADKQSAAQAAAAAAQAVASVAGGGAAASSSNGDGAAASAEREGQQQQQVEEETTASNNATSTPQLPVLVEKIELAYKELSNAVTSRSQAYRAAVLERWGFESRKPAAWMEQRLKSMSSHLLRLAECSLDLALVVGGSSSANSVMTAMESLASRKYQQYQQDGGGDRTKGGGAGDASNNNSNNQLIDRRLVAAGAASENAAMILDFAAEDVDVERRRVARMQNLMTMLDTHEQQPQQQQRRTRHAVPSSVMKFSDLPRPLLDDPEEPRHEEEGDHHHNETDQHSAVNHSNHNNHHGLFFRGANESPSPSSSAARHGHYADDDSAAAAAGPAGTGALADANFGLHVPPRMRRHRALIEQIVEQHRNDESAPVRDAIGAFDDDSAAAARQGTLSPAPILQQQQQQQEMLIMMSRPTRRRAAAKSPIRTNAATFSDRQLPPHQLQQKHQLRHSNEASGLVITNSAPLQGESAVAPKLGLRFDHSVDPSQQQPGARLLGLDEVTAPTVSMSAVLNLQALVEGDRAFTRSLPSSISLVTHTVAAPPVVQQQQQQQQEHQSATQQQRTSTPPPQSPSPLAVGGVALPSIGGGGGGGGAGGAASSSTPEPVVAARSGGGVGIGSGVVQNVMSSTLGNSATDRMRNIRKMRGARN